MRRQKRTQHIKKRKKPEKEQKGIEHPAKKRKISRLRVSGGQYRRLYSPTSQGTEPFFASLFPLSSWPFSVLMSGLSSYACFISNLSFGWRTFHSSRDDIDTPAFVNFAITDKNIVSSSHVICRRYATLTTARLSMINQLRQTWNITWVMRLDLLHTS